MLCNLRWTVLLKLKALKDKQKEAIYNLGSRDCFVILPTGYGKTLLLAYCMPMSSTVCTSEHLSELVSFWQHERMSMFMMGSRYETSVFARGAVFEYVKCSHIALYGYMYIVCNAYMHDDIHVHVCHASSHLELRSLKKNLWSLP